MANFLTDLIEENNKHLPVDIEENNTPLPMDWSNIEEIDKPLTVGGEVSNLLEEKKTHLPVNSEGTDLIEEDNTPLPVYGEGTPLEKYELVEVLG